MRNKGLATTKTLWKLQRSLALVLLGFSFAVGSYDVYVRHYQMALLMGICFLVNAVLIAYGYKMRRSFL